MTDHLTDADLVERLRLHAKHGAEAAAASLGMATSAFRQSIATARARGLSATSTIPDELQQLKAKLRIAESDLRKIARQNDDAESLRRTIFGLTEVQPVARWLKAAPKHEKGTTFSVPVAFWSDWHWGETVRRSEVGGVNEFNYAIAHARVQRLVDTTIVLARQHMGKIQYPGVVVCLGGDMISGQIHEELRETNWATVQQTLIEVQDEITSALTRMADEFGHVQVIGVVGNHGRMKMKPHAKHRIFENFEWSLYQQLERHFRDDQRIDFHIPEGPDAFFTVLGHRFMLTHGDALGVKGGDGLIGALGPIARGALKIGRAQAQIGRDFDTLMMGHWHLYIPRGDAAPVIVNPTLKGYDEFAHTILRVPYSRPAQSLTFVHAEHGITAQWQVYLEGRKKARLSAEWCRVERT